MNAVTGKMLYLSPVQIKVLFGYYFLVLVLSFGSSCAVFVSGPFSVYGYIELAFIGSAAMASQGSSVFYIRKLYKSVLSDLLTTDGNGDSQWLMKAMATFVYFFARPLFSVAFSLLLVIGVKSGLILSGGAQNELGYGFVQLTMFLSFFVGFLSGRFVRQLEEWGGRILDRVSGD